MNTTGNVPATITLTPDVKPHWLNVIRRLQSVCHGNQGYAVLSIQVLVDGTGKPVCWTEPRRIKLEPKSASFDMLLALTNIT